MVNIKICGEKMTDPARIMVLALEQAGKAAVCGEVPVGAVLADGTGRILAAARNQVIGLCDPTAHAEILALRQGAKAVGNYRLSGCVLYTTIEPCLMCMGAIVHARLAELVFGADDPKWGAAGSLYDFSDDPRLNHQLKVTSGVLADQSRELMQTFFRARRKHAAQGQI